MKFLRDPEKILMNQEYSFELSSFHGSYPYNFKALFVTPVLKPLSHELFKNKDIKVGNTLMSYLGLYLWFLALPQAMKNF